MSPKVRIAFMLVVAAQLALLIGMVGFKEFTLPNGNRGSIADRAG